MVNIPSKIIIICGEESGDLRAAGLVRAIKAQKPNVEFLGIGGAHSRDAGVTTFADITELAVMGFVEVIKHYPRIKKVFDLTVKKLEKEKPDALLLIDYPGFNLRLAKKAKALGIKVLYYVSPQIWAWKAGRIKLIKQVVDRMMVFFPFEKELYDKHNYSADFIGHPLMDDIVVTQSREDFLNANGLSSENKTLALLPGSRESEIVRHLPVMIEAISLIKKEHPEIQVILLQSKNIPRDLWTPYLKNALPEIITSSDYYNALNAADFCIVASGTATLETGLLEKPMTVIYKTSWLTSVLVRLLIKIPYVSLVNIVAGKKIVDELIQENMTPEKIRDNILGFIESPEKMETVRQDLLTMKKRLGEPGANRRAAAVVVEELFK